MNPGWGQAPRVPEAPAGDLVRHHEQAPAPSSPNSVARSREPNPFDELRRDEDRAGHPQPLTKTTYEGVCTATRRVWRTFCAPSYPRERAQNVRLCRRVEVQTRTLAGA
jgi:hypothetical protein